MRPKLIIIQGAPASGKTTISRRLVQQLDDVLLVSKDSIKEFLFDTQPAGNRDWSRLLGRASIAAMYEIAKVFLANGRSVMLESAFSTAYAQEDIRKLDADIFEVYCHCEAEVLIERFKARTATDRHAGHLDDAADYDIESMSQYQPLQIGMMTTVNTTAGIDDLRYEELIRNIKDFLEDK